MAGAKVFAVPELLENILLQCADTAIIDQLERPEGVSASTEPLRSLAPCHRVSRAFNNVLIGSCKLQQLMFGDSNPSYDGVSLPKSAPIVWLLAVQEKVFECWGQGANEEADFIYSIDFRHPAISTAPKGLRAREASWRRVKCHRGAGNDSKPLMGYFKSVSYNSTSPYDSERFLDVVEMHGDCTLGTFADWLDNSAFSGHEEEYQISVDYLYGYDAPLEPIKRGERGTLKKPQVLRESAPKEVLDEKHSDAGSPEGKEIVEKRPEENQSAEEQSK
ncbi:unnamed protein product [Zymoseptoria tritici ST99CH_1A5]|uniref:Uncharacterized protein n=3 Tax=Zymoseptoria tritici TaxID=1047171 RepID=A0A1X7S1K6_ZYMT9|nr:unnamed protein product [Zymoseptoria tritici ST99CH_3D7]SMR57146.1 unnamed protein product [Zymoseptoria tritici ST99CH_1E4]SMR60017.1 unnamed protein product [Zymoseptoria tritici ST99CH_3D1]SMY27202.1 unnamed protein product [Zymoseptoria tritici ST99CH_1A5]